MNAVEPRLAAAPQGVKPEVRALVVDENAASRSAVKGLLQSLGIEQVQQAGDPIRAIRLMESEAFTLVMCEAQFRSQMDGSQVLEFVRTRRLLAPSSAFVLMSGEAQRSLVASAREWQPDGFVLKPLTAAALGPRIEQALRRRRVQAPLFDAAERGDPEAVLAHARRLQKRAGTPSLELLRWQAQALIDLSRAAEARDVCDQALDLRADLPWAEVALAHCERAEGRIDEAVHRLRAVVRAHPSVGEAYDLLVDLLQEQGHVARALTVARQALEQLTTSQRLRTLGEIAYAQGELELAEDCYGELVRRTSASLTRNPVDTGMLGQVFVTRGAPDKALRVAASVENEPDVPSRALAAAVQAQAHSAQGDAERSEQAARRALSLAGTSEPSESVLLLVAQGAFAAGLRDEGREVAERAVTLRRRAAGPGALARKVLTEAGVEPVAFARTASRKAAARGKAQSDERLLDAVPATPATAATPAAAASAASVRARTGGAGGTDGTVASTASTASTTAATATTATTASEDVAAALRSMQGARFDDAALHVARARGKLPANPMVLMAAVQVQLMRMRAQGFDADTARDVRRCLFELDRQIPGDERVFPGLAD